MEYCAEIYGEQHNGLNQNDMVDLAERVNNGKARACQQKEGID